MVASSQLLRKLHAINYPMAHTFSATLEDLRHLIVWLEDRIIRIYPADKRLRDVNCNDWTHYLETNIPALTDWLVGKALLLSANDPNFQKHVNELSSILCIPNHPDSTQTFKAVCKLVKAKLTEDAIETALGEYGKTKIEMLKTSDICLGFEVSDPDVHNAALGLRLLNVNEMRRLQDTANSAIVQVQRLTADPQTDEKLGKVGY